MWRHTTVPHTEHYFRSFSEGIRTCFRKKNEGKKQAYHISHQSWHMDTESLHGHPSRANQLLWVKRFCLNRFESQCPNHGSNMKATGRTWFYGHYVDNATILPRTQMRLYSFSGLWNYRYNGIFTCFSCTFLIGGFFASLQPPQPGPQGGRVCTQDV